MQRALTQAVELGLRPLDRVRVRFLRALMPVSSRLAAAREPRVAVLGLLVITFALAATLAAPLWLLALGPIVLGVPHLLADVRYCVVRPGWHRDRRLWITAGLPLVAVAFDAPLEYGLLGVAATALMDAEAERARRVALVGAGVGLALVTRTLGSTADLIFAHAHNFIAVALWAAWRPRTTRLHGWVLGAFVLVSVALLGGAGDFAVAGGHGLAAALPRGLGLDTHLASLAPELAPTLGVRLVLLYAFAQSVHYGVWLRLVPEEDRGRATPRSFRATFRALVDDFSPLVLALVGLGALGLAVWACVDLYAARTGYLRFARFHGTLELFAAALLILRGPGERA